MAKPIGQYEKRPAICDDWDPKAAEVGARLAAPINDELPDVLVEHIGSSSIPGCAARA